jgi:hypothetical protein
MEMSMILETPKKVFQTTIGVAVSSQGASRSIATLWDDHIWTLEVNL